MLGSLTGVLSGALTPPLSSSSTALLPGIVAFVPSGNVTVTVPSFPTSTSVAVGLAFLTASFTFSFSASVKLLGSLTGVFSGTFTSVVGSTILFPGIVTVDPSGNVTVTVPSFPTSTSVAVGFSFLTASFTFSFSASVKLLGSLTGVFSGTFTSVVGSTILFPGIVTVDPSGNVTVTVPSFPTSTSVTVGFSFLTASFTFSFSASVKLLGSLTGVFSGTFTSVIGVAFAGALGSDTFPSGVVAFAVISPTGSSTVGAIVAFPSFPATPSPILFPSLSNNSTLDPGVAVTSTGVLVPAFPVKSVLISGFDDVVGLELESLGSVPLSASSLSVKPSPSVSAFLGSVPLSASSLSVKPSPSVSAFVGVEPGSLTITLTGTSSVDPSGYVTTTVASFSPGVVVSTGSLKATVVPLGRSFTFPIESSAFGVVPLFTVCGLAVGSFLSASVGAELGSLTVTLTGTSSVDPSGYVTTTVASFLPGVAVSTGSLKATVVPLGRSFTFPIESSAFGVVPLFTVCGLAVGVFLSASVGFLVTNSDKGFLSFEPSAYVTTTLSSASLVID